MKSRLHKLTALLLTFAMILSFMQGLTSVTHAASIAKNYNYKIKVKNSGDTYSGTDSDVFCIVKTHSGGRQQVKIDSKKNDFEKNDCREYTVNLELQPWEIKEVGLRCGGSDGMKIAWFEWKLPNETVVRKDINAWFENEKNKTAERTYSVWTSVDRQVKTTGNFDTQFSGKKYYSPTTVSGQSDIVMDWNRKVSDQYFSEYNFFDYFGAVGIKFYPTAKSYGYAGISDMNGMSSFAKTSSVGGFDNKITISTNALLNYMRSNQIFKLDLKSVIDYLSTSDEYSDHSKTFTIIRTAFQLERATVITAPYVPAENKNYKDYKFFNSNDKYKTFKIKIPVKSLDNYNASTIANSLAANINNKTSTAKVYYDAYDKNKKTNPEKCIVPKRVTTSGSDIYFECDVPADYPNLSSVGLTVVIENPKATYDGRVYTLYQKNEDGDFVTDYDCYLSDYKVDTKGLTHTIKDENNNVVDTTTGFNTYKKEHGFQLGVEAGQKIFIDNNKGGRTEGNFSYRLYTKGGTSEVELAMHNGLSATSNVPHSGGTVYRVAPTAKIEGEYDLVITSKDIADNLSTTTIPVKLDTLAPRVNKSVKAVAPVDGSKRNEYKFKIDDKSGSGKLHYVFVRDGEKFPDPSKTKPDSSGSVDTVYEQWGFIGQQDSNTQSVVLNVEKGGIFRGGLYWYTEDEAGNDSRKESHNTAGEKIYYNDGNAYYYEKIELSNIDTGCEIILDDVTPGKTEYNIGFETNALNKVQYRWKNGSLTTPYFDYKSSSKPGSKTQKNGSGQSVTLDGDCTLEYVVIAPDGTKKTYTKDFVYDNSKPTVTIDSGDKTITESRSFTITVKDISSIETLKYQLFTSDGTAAGEETELPAGVLSNEIVVTPEKTGAYKIKVTATDANGYTTEKQSTIFSVRNSSPEIELRNNVYNDINGVPVTNSQNYTITAWISEDVANLKDFDANQILRYRTSSDGVNYSDWVIQTDNVNRYGNELAASVEITSPVALNSGDNRIYIQAMFASKGDDTTKVRNEFIATNNETVIIYDIEGPQYKLEIGDSEMTNKNVPGTLSYIDNYTPASEIRISSDYCNITVNSENDIMSVADLVFTDNVEDGSIVIVDTAGNITEVPVTINCIDKDPPKIEAERSQHFESGSRIDFDLSFWIDEAMDEKTSFALFENTEYDIAPMPTYGASPPPIDQAPFVDPSAINDNLFGPLPENIQVLNKETQYDYENGESKNYFELKVYADEEKLPTSDPGSGSYWEEYDELNNKSYILVARSEDAVGNVTKQSIGYAMKLRNCTADVNQVFCAPETAGSKSVVYMNMTVPVYVMPDSEVPEAMKNIEDGRIDTSTDEAVVEFAESVINHVTDYSLSASFAINGTGEYPIYFTDECKRVYKQTIKVKDLSQKYADEDWDEYTAYASFGNEPPVTATLYEAPYGEYDPSNWTPKSTDGLKALDLEGEYNYYVVIEGNDDTVTLNRDDAMTSGGDNPDFIFDDDLSVYDYEAYGYTKLVYLVGNTPNPNRFISYTANYVNEGVDETSGSVYELDLLDVTAPKVDVYYSTKGYTKDNVTVTLTAYDRELSVSTDAGDTNSDGSDPEAGENVELKDELAPDELAKNAGIARIEVSEISSEPVYAYDYEELSHKDLGQVSSAEIEFENNGYAVAKITNTEGLASYVEIEVNNINKDVIEKDVHYEVNYYYINNEGTKTLCNPDDYYKNVIAKIEFTDEGIERELEILNNGGKNEKTLDSFDSMFMFRLKDKYGHTADAGVSFSKFDTAGPLADYELLNKAKTNQPVDVELKVTDLLSVAASASLTDSNGQDISAEFVREEAYGDTNLVTKVFKATIEDSGFYKITATDILGNVTYKNFNVNNIDKTAPYVVEQKATSAEDTRQNVGVKLYYSESNVKITNVELNETSTFTSDDVSVDYNNSVIRFDENGVVSVWYEDEYGNECTVPEVVTVGNINRTTPSMSAVTTVADDALSAEVSFVKNDDEMRDLSKLYIMYGGTTPMIVEEDRIATAADDIKFTFIDNGTYTFYIYDSIGNIQKLPVEITGIDRKAPVITEVSWSYKYVDDTGNETEVTHKLTPGDEAGYNIVEDDKYKATNRDITATVKTDDPTRFVGSGISEYSTTHSIIYDEDGWFNFNLEKPNSLMDRYGLGLYLIDKEPPVIENVDDLMFFENEAANAKPYSKDLLTCTAYDERYGVKSNVEVDIDWGGFNPDDIKSNTFDKNKPYTVTYTATDKVGNVTSVKRTITLVGLFDTMIRVNGKYPDSSGRIEVIGDTVEIVLDNFGGTAYATYEKGIYTMGEMKHMGTVIAPTGNKFKLDKLSEGWYTFYVQTDLKDYFCVNVYVFNK